MGHKRIPQLHITRGIPASGKTTWAKTWVNEDPDRRARVNRDDFRLMLYGAPVLDHNLEKAVQTASRAAVEALLKSGRDVVADDMNVRPTYVREWARFAAAHGAELVVHEFPIDMMTAIKRDAARVARGERGVGEDVLRMIVDRYLDKGRLLPLPDPLVPVDDPSSRRWYTPSMTAKPAIMVDLDGTAALLGDRNPYDLTTVSHDKPNPAVLAAVQGARLLGYTVIFCSGREDSARDDTEAWLEKHYSRRAFTEPLYMREDGDKRRDSIVKLELFDKHIRDRYQIMYVLDDRNQVVDMWRSIGLTTFQVAPGNF